MQLKSLRLKINIAIGISLFIIAVIYSIVLASFEVQRRQDAIEKIKLFCCYLTDEKREQVGNEIFGRHKRAVEVSLQEILSREEIIDASVYGNDGVLLVSTKKEDTPDLSKEEMALLLEEPSYREQKYSNRHVLTYTSAIMAYGVTTGFWKIHYSLANLNRETFKIIIIFVSLFILLLILISGLLNVLLSRLILKHVYSLNNIMSKVKDGNLGLQAEVHSKDEIGEMTNMFNSMSREIEVKTEQYRLLNENLEHKVMKRTKEIEIKNKVIMEGINYAQLIQHMILPKKFELQDYFSEHFIIWKPKDIIGGDIYWFKPFLDFFLLALIDCVGHGIPAALMSMTAHALLNQIVDEICFDDPSRILKETYILMKKELPQDEFNTNVHVGMDMSLCYIHPKKRKLIFAGINQSLFFNNKNNICAIPGNKGFLNYDRIVFKNNELNLKEDTVYYLTTDGYIDQMDRHRTLIFGNKRFKNILQTICKDPLQQQKEILEKELETYMGGSSQCDDITVFGFKI